MHIELDIAPEVSKFNISRYIGTKKIPPAAPIKNNRINYFLRNLLYCQELKILK